VAEQAPGPAGELSAAERDARREAASVLGAALRELIDAAVLTEVPIEELTEAAEAARQLASRLRVQSRRLPQIAAIDDPEVGERWYNPVYGPGNPLAPPLEVIVSAQGRVSGRVTLGKPYEGPPGLLHGGVTATLLDHALARAARSAGHGGLTASLTVRYRRPVPLGVPLLLDGRLEGVDGRRATAHATLAAAADPGTPLAEGEALLIALTADRAAEVFAPTGRSVGAWTARS
jgi:acyl-coenzyme A thioesterase PaaI-like protein